MGQGCEGPVVALQELVHGVVEPRLGLGVELDLLVPVQKVVVLHFPGLSVLDFFPPRTSAAELALKFTNTAPK